MSQRTPLIAALVAACAAHARLVALIGLVLALGCAGYAATHFAMSTNTDELISHKLPWRARNAAFDAVFPQTSTKTIVVIDGRTPEIGEAAAAALTARMQAQPELFHSVDRPDAGDFWTHEGLLYLPLPEVRENMDKLVRAQPFLGPVAADPSLRGLMTALQTGLTGVATGQAKLSDLDGPMARLGDALDALEGGKPVFFSWRELTSGGTVDQRQLRHLVLVDPKQNFGALEPGQEASAAIRADAAALGLDAAHGVRVRLTGSVPVEDEEFATLADRAILIGVLAVSAIVFMLWMAVRSPRLIAAIVATTAVGLVSAMALGLVLFGRFNVISVAFIPLFVGLGIDFGIQFSVRYRSERHGDTDVRAALIASGRGMGRSLTLAAAAIASGFLAFAPTDYYGVSQLGVIAGVGMVLALVLNLTLLPALIELLKPPGAPVGQAQRRLDAVDHFVLGHRRLILGSSIGAGLVSAALLPLVHFDFNPIHLRSPKVESVSTLFDLMQDPIQSPNTLESIRPNLATADALAARLRTLPQVWDARTASSLVPTDQPAKLAVVGDTAKLMDLTLNPIGVAPPPADAEVVSSLGQTASALRQAATGQDQAARDARRLADALDRLARGSPAVRAQAAETLMPGLQTVLGQIRASLQPQPVTLESLPPDLRRAWLAPDGRARVSAIPRGDSNDNAVLSGFIAAVTAVAPDASGWPIAIEEGGRVVVGAFVEAGVLSFVAICALLFIVLRRVRDVAITMAPIILTGLLTMASCVVIGQPLNFANIIALPLLFGIGVAFHIYFVMSWRSGGSHLLSSSLARAIFFSALTTATGFGSLWASSHPGTASMGKLLMISLIWTLVSALLFQPALMGPPPERTAPAAGAAVE